MMCKFIQFSLALLWLGSTLQAANLVWDGSESSNWSNGANWVGGIAPVNGDSVWLTNQGYSPSNMDIVGLSIATLYFGEFTNNGANPETVATNPPAEFTLTGQALTLTGGTDSPQGYPSTLNYTIRNDIVLNAGTINFQHRTPITVTFSGNISETGGSRSLGTNWTSGATFLTGKNSFTGKVLNYAGTISFVKDENLGTPPASFTADQMILNSSWGEVLAGNQSDTFFNDIWLHPKRGVQANFGFLQVDSLARLSLQGNVLLTNANDFIHGELLLHAPMDGTSTSRYLRINGNSAYPYYKQPFVKMRHPLAMGSTYINLNQDGFLDLNGYSLSANMQLTRWPQSGYCGVVNLNTATTATLEGEVYVGYHGLYVGASLSGPGDITVNGTIKEPSSGVDQSALQWGGTGTLTLAGNVTGWDYQPRFNRGNVVLDHRANNTVKLLTSAAGNVLLSSCNVTLMGSDSAASTEFIGGVISGTSAPFYYGMSRIRVLAGSNQDATFTLDNLGHQVRNAAADFYTQNNGTGTAIIATLGHDSNENNGTLNPAFTFAGNTWAKVDGSNHVVGLAESGYVSTLTADSHVSLPSGTTTLSSSLDISSLRFNAAGSAILVINGAGYDLRLGTSVDNNDGGGVLISANVGASDVVISGAGDLAPRTANCAVFVHQYNTAGNLTISSRVTGVAYLLCKTGPGELVLSNSNNDFDVAMLYEGTVTFDAINDSGSISQLGKGDIVLGSATLRYIGSGHSTNRQVQLQGDSTLDASGSGTLRLTKSTGVYWKDTTHNPNTTNHFSHLTLTGSGNGQIDGIIELLYGQVTKRGNGTWTLGGNNVYIGPTTIESGTLRVTSHLDGECQVRSGATLAGSGNIRRGLELGGDWNVELRGDSDFDHFTAGGCVVLGGNLNVSLAAGFEPQSCFTLLSGSSNISGSFNNVTAGYRLIVKEKSLLLLPTTFVPPATIFRLK
jgi:autotransporter-associated beta strand protein